MSDRWVLILAYHFPPENAIGGLRPFRFYKYLPEHGFKCHVITAADVTVRPDLRAERVIDPFFSSTAHDFGWQKERLIRKVLLPGVVGIQWSSLVISAAESFLRDKQADEVTIFSTWPPLGTHLAGWRLSRRHKLRWIADFRDPLAGNPANAGLGPQTHTTYSWLERTFLRSADAFIANTDEAQRMVREKYPGLADKVHLLWNGFDPELRIEPLPLPARPQRVFSHVGELYEGRTVAPLIEAVARLISTGRVAPGSLQIQLVGPAAAACLPGESLMREGEAKGWLKVVPKQIPRDEAQQISQTSDGLLIIQPQSAIQVPGKLFDYLQIGRPILAVVPPESSIERVLARSGIPYRTVYKDCSAETFESALLDYFALSSDPVRPSPWFEETFNCRSQTGVLAGLIDAAHS
jgi:Glycosyltransferase Family 4